MTHLALPSRENGGISSFQLARTEEAAPQVQFRVDGVTFGTNTSISMENTGSYAALGSRQGPVRWRDPTLLEDKDVLHRFERGVGPFMGGGAGCCARNEGAKESVEESRSDSTAVAKPIAAPTESFHVD